MKFKRFLLSFILVVALIATLAGCNNIQYSEEYKQVFYSAGKAQFIETGNTLRIFEDYKYEESYALAKDTKVLKGTYVSSSNGNVLHAELNASDMSSFKRSYRAELKQMGYTNSEIDNIILPSIDNVANIFKYKGYLFKLSAVVAAMQGDPVEVGALDGIYRIDGILGKKTSTIKLVRGNIFLRELDDFGNDKYEKKLGIYELSGDMITITPLDPNGDPRVKDANRYLLADVTLPDSFVDDVNKDGYYNGNELIKPVKGAKTKVIVACFYTTKDTK